jgi:3-oxoacyl-[acyl-carrier-protein] synthase II
MEYSMIGRSRRVVITGVGLVSPLGDDKETFWGSLVDGVSGVAAWSLVSPDALPVPFGAEARHFRGAIDDFGPLGKDQAKAIRKGLKVMCRECQMGCAAAQKAMTDAALAPGSFDPERVGIAFGTDHMVTMPEDFSESILPCLDEEGQFDFSRWATEGMPKMNPLWLLKYLPNMPACHLAMYNDLRGPNNSMTLREAAANVALVEAFQTILQDRAEVMVVGSTGTRIHPIKAIHSRQQEELADKAEDPARACRPFDRQRTGMVLGEGAGAVVLEDFERAVSRGARIYAEILGGASSSVAGADRQADRYQALRNALTMTFGRTDCSPDKVGFVNAHGLSTRSADVEEARAIHDVFQDRATPVPVVAPKSHFGNLGAGSGMVELIAGVLALNQGQLFPVLNYEDPDPDCPITVVAAGQSWPAGESFVNLSFTPQGQASVTLVRRMS